MTGRCPGPAIRRALATGLITAAAIALGPGTARAQLGALVSPGRLNKAHASLEGILLAVASGALTSGVGYSVWYAALRHLSATQAAVLQLTVPILAAVAAIVEISRSRAAGFRVSTLPFWTAGCWADAVAARPSSASVVMVFI